MKILTLNTHSLQEDNYEEKLGAFLEFTLRERPDLIALQEVNQSADAPIARDFCGMIRLPEIDIPLKADNHALRVAGHLEREGVPVSWAYLPIKLGYGRYDEGVAVLSLNAGIVAADICTVSHVDDYQNWRTRKALGVRVEGCADWFYSMHMGWWQDELEPFALQWRRLDAHLSERKGRGRVWLLGDFNSPAQVRGQGYDLIAESGWKDSYFLAQDRDDGLTVRGVIDGWRGLIADADDARGMRIDHIWCSGEAQVRRSRVVFSGRFEPVVSDHFGVMIETKGET